MREKQIDLLFRAKELIYCVYSPWGYNGLILSRIMKEGNTFDNLARELRIRNYSKKTANSYIRYNQEFLRFCEKDPREATAEDIKNYLDYLAQEWSWKQINRINYTKNRGFNSQKSGDCQKCDTAYLAPFVCHAFARKWHGYTVYSRIVGACQASDHPNLHSCGK